MTLKGPNRREQKSKKKNRGKNTSARLNFLNEAQGEIKDGVLQENC